MARFTLGLLVIIIVSCGLGAIVDTDAAGTPKRETKTGNGTTSYAERPLSEEEEKRELWGAASRKPEERRRETSEDGVGGESSRENVQAAAQGIPPGLTVVFSPRHPCSYRLAGDHSCVQGGGGFSLWRPMQLKKLLDFRPSRVIIRDFDDINPFESVTAPMLSAADRPSNFVSAELPKEWRPVPPDFLYVSSRPDFEVAISSTSPVNVTAEPPVFVPVTASIDVMGTSASDDSDVVDIDASVEVIH